VEIELAFKLAGVSISPNAQGLLDWLKARARQ
jgi:hypothetical protein